MGSMEVQKPDRLAAASHIMLHAKGNGAGMRDLRCGGGDKAKKVATIACKQGQA